MTVFRVHFSDAQHRDVEADDPKEAAAKAKADHNRIITKIKRLRDGGETEGSSR
jgi:hypothetical protein